MCYVTEVTRFVACFILLLGIWQCFSKLKRNCIKYMELFWNTISFRADKLGCNALIKFLIRSTENLKSSTDAQGASQCF